VVVGSPPVEVEVVTVAVGVEALVPGLATAPEAAGSGLVAELVPLGEPVVSSPVVQSWEEPAGVGGLALEAVPGEVEAVGAALMLAGSADSAARVARVDSTVSLVAPVALQHPW
jgi:hypothetical protein